jgi:hypothetical protein
VIERRARGSWFGAKNRKLSVGGSVSVNDVWVGSDLGSGELVGVGECQVEQVGGRDRAARKGGGLLGPQNPKPSSCGSVFVNG